MMLRTEAMRYLHRYTDIRDKDISEKRSDNYYILELHKMTYERRGLT